MGVREYETKKKENVRIREYETKNRRMREYDNRRLYEKIGEYGNTTNRDFRRK